MDTQQVLEEVKGALKIYHGIATMLQWIITILGIIAIGCSLAVTAFTDELLIYNKVWVKLLSFVSTLIVSLFTVFNILGKHTDIRKAWRHLNYAYLKFNAGNLELRELVEAKNDAELMRGYIDFNSASMIKPVKDTN